MEWKKYRKKPVFVEAIQWNPDEDASFLKADDRLVSVTCGVLKIVTMSRSIVAHPGDWIVKYDDGFLDVYDNFSFGTYEEIE